MREITRRGVLSGMAASGALALAGCVSEEANDDNDGNDDTTDTDGEGGDDDVVVEVLDSSIETTNVVSGSQSDQVETLDYDGDTVIVTGSIPAPNPCHEAVLEGASVEQTKLSIDIDVEDVSGTQACTEVVATVEYEASITVSDAAQIDSVVVHHRPGESHELTGQDEGGAAGSAGAGSSDDDEGFAILESMIETTDQNPQGSNPDWVEVSRDDSVVTVTGTTPAPTPNQEAIIEATEQTNGTLSVSIATRSTLDDDEAGITVLGEIEYQAQFVVSRPENLVCVEVTHVYSDETYGC